MQHLAEKLKVWCTIQGDYFQILIKALQK